MAPARGDICDYGPHTPDAPALLATPQDDGTDLMYADRMRAVMADNARQQDLYNRQQAARSPTPIVSNGSFEYRASATSLPYGWALVGSPTLTATSANAAGLGDSLSWSGVDVGISYTFDVKPCTWYTCVWDCFGVGKVDAGSWDGSYTFTSLAAMPFSVGAAQWVRYPNANGGQLTFKTGCTILQARIQLTSTTAGAVGFAQVQVWEGSSARPFQDPAAAGAKMRVYDDGVLASYRGGLDFIATGNITTAITDDSSNDWAGITLDTIQGIQTTSTPRFLRMGLGQAANAVLGLCVLSASYAEWDARYNVLITDSTAFGSTPGAGIVFSHKYNTAGNFVDGGAIHAGKLTAVDGNTASKMTFCVYTDGTAGLDERMRLTGTGLFVGGNLAATAQSAAQLEVFDSGGTQMRLSYTAASKYCDFTVDGSGNLKITPSGGGYTWAGTFGYAVRWGWRPASDTDPSITWYKADGITAVMTYNTLTPGMAITGTLQATRLGVGAAAHATVPMYALATTEQFRCAYSASVYTSFTTDSSGNLTITPTGSGLKAFTVLSGAYTGTAQTFSVLNEPTHYKFDITAANPLGDVVTWTFRETNNNILYDNMLVLDRGNIGMGVGIPAAKLEVLSTTEQIRASYSAAVYASHTVASTGVYTITQTGTNLTLSKALNVGTYAGASAVGDFSAGVSGGRNLLWDISSSSLLLSDATDTTIVNFDNSVISRLYLGVTDTRRGAISLSGHATGTHEGGELLLCTSADYDTTVDYYGIWAYDDYLKIGRTTNADLKIDASGDVTIANKIGFYGTAPAVQGATIADPSGGSVVDTEARTAINALIDRLQATGYIAT